MRQVNDEMETLLPGREPQRNHLVCACVSVVQVWTFHFRHKQREVGHLAWMAGDKAPKDPKTPLYLQLTTPPCHMAHERGDRC